MAQAVEDAVALAPVGDQTRAPEIGEVTGYVRLGDAQDALHVAPAQLPLEQQVDEAQSRHVSPAIEVASSFFMSMSI
jgi:hypothetical protein